MKSQRKKGRAFVLKIIDKLRNELDNGTYEVSGSGAGLDKGDIRIPSMDLVIEAKDHAKAQVATWTEQSEREGLGYSKTALFWKHPKSPSTNPDIRVDMNIDLFIEMAKRFQEPLTKEPDRQISWHLKNLIQSAKQVLKDIE